VSVRARCPRRLRGVPVLRDGTQRVTRSAAERDEWRAAGTVESGLERAMVALALARRRHAHATAEGIER